MSAPFGPLGGVQNLSARSGVDPRVVAPGPPPGSPPSPGGGPAAEAPGPQAMPGAPPQASGGIPAPNSQGFISPAQAQIIQAVFSDPILAETVLNVVMQGLQQAQGMGQGGAPGAPPGGGAAPGLNPQAQASQQLLGRA